jgi:hypothetical protein
LKANQGRSDCRISSGQACESTLIAVSVNELRSVLKKGTSLGIAVDGKSRGLIARDGHTASATGTLYEEALELKLGSITKSKFEVIALANRKNIGVRFCRNAVRILNAQVLAFFYLYQEFFAFAETLRRELVFD